MRIGPFHVTPRRRRRRSVAIGPVRVRPRVPKAVQAAELAKDGVSHLRQRRAAKKAKRPSGRR